ncbi:MAG: HAD-IIIA family hydrolase [Rhodospirillales bacterium]|nr:HAD-IIIA family hydrolase [Rhodospirillales bacterium]
MPATIRQCAILAGGLGTRLGDLTATTPKPLLPCGDRPFLAWLMREFQRFGVEEFVLLTGHLSDAVEQAVEALARSLPRPARITLSVEPVRAGTGGAVFHARDRLDERFLLCNGDSLFDGNLSRLLAAAAATPALGWMMLRRVPDASRYGVVTLEGNRITAFQERPAPGAAGLINAGVYLLDRTVLDRLAPVCSLERDLLPRLAAEGALRGVQADGYFRDIGIPEDLARARSELPAVLRRRALFLDRDGVINVDHGYVGSRDRFEFLPGALEAIRAATEAGWHVFVVTNQSGVARGLYTEAAVQVLLAWVADEARAIGGTLDDVRYCPYHTDAALPEYRRESDWRKPGPGMLLDLIRAWEVDPLRSAMIGDQPTDLQAAAAAGVPGHLFGGGNLLDFVRPILAR